MVVLLRTRVQLVGHGSQLVLHLVELVLSPLQLLARVLLLQAQLVDLLRQEVDLVRLLGHQIIIRVLDHLQLFAEYLAASFKLVFLDGERLDGFVFGARVLLERLPSSLQQLLLIGQLGRRLLQVKDLRAQLLRLHLHLVE